MSFNLFGFDFDTKDSLYGFWVCSLQFNSESSHRMLLGFYKAEGDWFFNLLWFNIK